MIDLRFDGLPGSLVVDGEAVPVDTDFRAWIAFGYAAERGIADLRIFQDGTAPAGEWQESAAEFYESPNPFPRGGAEGGERVLDLVLDGDFIVAAFQQAYGIDLTDPGLSMHWHRFLALLRGLPEDTALSRVMGFRGWRADDGRKGREREMRERRAAWALPPIEEPLPYAMQDDPLEGLYEEPDLGGLPWG